MAKKSFQKCYKNSKISNKNHKTTEKLTKFSMKLLFISIWSQNSSPLLLKDHLNAPLNTQINNALNSNR